MSYLMVILPTSKSVRKKLTKVNTRFPLKYQEKFTEIHKI